MTSTGFRVLNEMAQLSLDVAISSERAKLWGKAIENYKKLLRFLNTIKISEKVEMDPQLKQLLYETYYHMGVAYQNINHHEEAVLHYTKALQAASIQKKNCAVGCTVGTCLHTPILTRRAFAFVKCGETRKALRDADTAVVSDKFNPDVYCIWALVWCTMQKEAEAIKDLNYGLRINPSHACLLILRGNIKKYMRPENNSDLPLNNDQEKALQINYASIKFLGVKNFSNPDISAFYNTMLWSLNVPHTVVSVCRPPACSTAQSVLFHLQRASSAPVPRNQNEHFFTQDQHQVSFRGSDMTRNAPKIGLERRLNYGRAVTAYTVGLRGIGRKDFENNVQLCDSFTVCTRSSLQKYLRCKIYEATDFSTK
ncbi:uncharacterized protein LOC122925685 isoform X1 [Bufo gargarizans]|uniref:uncharacterized protein LOC122925685 isoform X1 n=1 Tax=Bufo gargarizans TaxID=30331 RepID=UPI001CF12CCB|nr:uncharacterized protein LOC122925685 isoform X1 [Bufo gargarizans]